MLNYLRNRYAFDTLGTNWTTEFVAGVSLFMSISYIFIVNPAILSQAGIPSGAVFFATVSISAFATLVMGWFAKLPFALAPGLESNGFFTFVVVATLGFSWQEGLSLVFWSGVLSITFTAIPVRQRIIDAIPEGLKAAIATTVGVFVMIIGLVVTDLITFSDGLPSGIGSFGSEKVILLYVGFAISFALSWKTLNFPAGMMVAIVVCTILARLLGIPADTPPANYSEFLDAFAQLNWFSVFDDPRAWVVLVVFFMIDFYGSIGKFIGLTRNTTLQDPNAEGSVRNMKEALYVDGGASAAGAVMGTSTVITYVESAVAIGQGGRTGIVALVCGILMLASLAFAPLVAFVPVAAASGVLVYVGWLLFPKYELVDVIQGRNDKNGSLDYSDFVVILFMALIASLTFSLDKSMLVGFVAYTIKQLVEEHKINPYLLASSIFLGMAMWFQYFNM